MKLKNVPALRFPDFNGDWVEVVLNEFSDIKTGPFGSSLHQEDYVLEGTPIVTVEHLSDFGLVHSNLPRVTDKDKLRLKSYTLLENDIVFSRVGSVDRNSLIKETEAGWLFSGRLLRIRIINKELIDAAFLSNIFQSDYTKYRIRSVAVGQTMASLNTQILKNFNVLVSPNIAEQQKIAAFLTAVDDKIQQLSKKKALLEQFKKGVMQQIFSQQIRFKPDRPSDGDDQGNEYPEWEEKKLGDVVKFYKGSPLSKSDINPSGARLCIHYGELFTTYKEVINSINLRTNVSGFLSKAGDILMPTSDVTPIGLATASAILVDNVVLGGDINVLRPIDIEPIFLSYVLNFEKKQIIQLVSGTTVKHIYSKDLKGVQLVIPSNVQEQTKIASFLSAIDDKINHVTRQIAHTRQYKKGLLQQMFV